MTVIRLIARPMLASTFAVGAVTALRNAPALAEKSKPVIDKVVPSLEQAAPQVLVQQPEPQVTVQPTSGTTATTSTDLIEGTGAEAADGTQTG